MLPLASKLDTKSPNPERLSAGQTASKKLLAATSRSLRGGVMGSVRALEV